jgi:hypothetical protein
MSENTGTDDVAEQQDGSVDDTTPQSSGARFQTARTMIAVLPTRVKVQAAVVSGLTLIGAVTTVVLTSKAVRGVARRARR